ncbi:MAG TPA: divalent metal cation transporter [Methylomirabilota bacterium]|jgi:NRAMP (natural resistance-associated macrophage protein)-like metal ion transporter|nr:divalent metal cation transporter [Methylomirabilota bacterium]
MKPDPSATPEPTALSHTHNPLFRYFQTLGPGLVTGASDDDPSGIATYSVAGAAYGYGLLWTALFTFPLMAAIQLVCARIGLVTGRGLAGAVRKHYPRWLLLGACFILLVANVFNIAADLGGMAEAGAMLTGVPAVPLLVLFGIGITLITVYTSYVTFARYLKWLTAVLFAYIIAAFLAHPDWPAVVRATFVPSLQWNGASVSTLVGILGTTISPYLFFWQASHEVEEEKSQGKLTVAQRKGATPHELADARLDVNTGMFFSNLVMYFIILATASTLYKSGHRDIQTARQAAEALRPMAGDAAYVLFSLGLIGTGLLAIPVLAGSASFAIAELFGWRAGLDLKPRSALRFYLVLSGAIVCGTILGLLQTDPIRVLFFSAVLNGLLAPPLMVLVMMVGSNRKIMGEHVNGLWLKLLGWTATALMTIGAIAFFATLGS